MKNVSYYQLITNQLILRKKG